jgi:hypothetical protein
MVFFKLVSVMGMSVATGTTVSFFSSELFVLPQENNAKALRK